jgi:predicted Zn-dependent protease
VFSRIRKIFPVLVLLAAVLSAAEMPARAQIFGLNPTQEQELGRSAAMEVERRYPVTRDAAMQRRIQAIGNRLAAHSGRRIPYHFRVLDLRDVNAFALPGGYVYINRGAVELAQSDSEIGGVLAHEIAHVVERHGVKQAEKGQFLGLGLGVLDMLIGGRGMAGSLASLGAQMAGEGVYSKYSRDAEREADREGVIMMRRAGMDPHGMLTFMHRMAQLQRSNPGAAASFFSSHPSLAERERNIAGLIGARAAAPQTLPNRNAYAAPRRETAAPARWETLRDSDGRVLRFRRNS